MTKRLDNRGHKRQQRILRWELYNVKTDESVAESTFPDKVSASKALAYIKTEGGRVDLQEQKDDLWIRPVETYPSGSRTTVSGRGSAPAIPGAYALGFRGEKSPTAKKHKAATKGQRKWNNKGREVAG